jgi:hypothetical protein
MCNGNRSRRLDYIDVNVMGLQEFINEPAVRGFMGGAGSDVPGNIPIGENCPCSILQDMIMDPAYADDLAVLLKTVSHELSHGAGGAQAKLDELTADADGPDPGAVHVFESRPRMTALRPMVDVLFPPEATGDLQSVLSGMTEFEYVSETTLRDRVDHARDMTRRS